MNTTQQEKAIDVLKDWIKWIVGLNFGSATGCILILQQGVSSTVRLYLISAVFAFCFSIILSSFVFLVLPAIIQRLPIDSTSKKMTSIYDYPLTNSLSLRFLIVLQFALFAIGVVSVFAWVLLKK